MATSYVSCRSDRAQWKPLVFKVFVHTRKTNTPKLNSSSPSASTPCRGPTTSSSRSWARLFRKSTTPSWWRSRSVRSSTPENSPRVKHLHYRHNFAQSNVYIFSQSVHIEVALPQAAQLSLFYWKLRSVALPWGTWIKDALLTKRIEKTKKPSSWWDLNPRPLCWKVFSQPLCCNRCL